MYAATILSQAVSSTNNYKSKPLGRGRVREKAWTIDWDIVGTLSGTLVIEVSNSDDQLIALDLGDAANQTDKAVWRTFQPIYDATDSLVASGAIAITNSTSDGIVIEAPGWNAIRVKYTNATGSGTIVIRYTSREVN